MARFAAFYSETTTEVWGYYGAVTDGRTFSNPAKAVEHAELLIADGHHGVTVQNLEECLYRRWAECGVGDATYRCVRHDLHSDGRCALHTDGGTAPKPLPRQPSLLTAEGES